MTFKPNYGKSDQTPRKRPVAPSYVGPAEPRPKPAAGTEGQASGTGARPFRSGSDRPANNSSSRPPRDGAPRPFRSGSDRPSNNSSSRPPRDGASRPFRSGSDRPLNNSSSRPPRDGAPRPFRSSSDRPSNNSSSRPPHDGAPRDGAPRPFRSGSDRPSNNSASRPPHDSAPRDGAPRQFRSGSDRPSNSASRPPRDGAPRPDRGYQQNTRDSGERTTGPTRVAPSFVPQPINQIKEMTKLQDVPTEVTITAAPPAPPAVKARRKPISVPVAVQPIQVTADRMPAAMQQTPVALDQMPAAVQSVAVEVQKTSIAAQKIPLKVIPLGGLREIGKNLTIFEYDQDMIIVDCGVAFPEEDMPGIDVIIPDFSYIIRNKSKLRGIFLTHGHEDHIGALPWLCKEVNVPIYGNSLTIALTRLKLEDRGTDATGVSLNSVKDGDRVTAGVFDVEFIHTNHSIADANALAIHTPAGIIFHSGDFKIDYTPVNGKPMDLSRVAAIGAEGVLLMMCESTNVERKGYTPSESKVGETFADIFAKATGRIIVATFSSNVFRLQQIISAAENQNRKVALVGRSMLNVFAAANELGYIKMRSETLIDIDQMDRYDASDLVLISTGSQGEPMSALTRMAFSEHRRVDIIPGDTVVISASPIPGNEKPIYRVINELFKRGAHVVYESLSEIHVSGHAFQEELKLLHSLVRPRYFIPGHGEYRHLYRHAELAHQLGQEWKNIFILGNGDILEVTADAAQIVGFTNAAGVLIDGSSIGDIDNLVLRDRKLLADDGVVAVFIALNQKTGELIGQPDVQARGFIYESETEQIIEECIRKINNFVRRAQTESKPLAAMINTGALRDQLRDLLFDRTKRRPIIMISVIEV